MNRVVVVGGGISGLVAAHELKQRAKRSDLDLEVLCYEAEKAPGGSVQTVRRDGFLMEAGPSGLRDSGGIAKLIRRLKLTSRRVDADPESQDYHLVRDGKLRRLPRSMDQLLLEDSLPLTSRLRVLAEPLARSGAIPEDESIAEFATRRLGRGAGELLADALATAVTAGDSRLLSMRSTLPALHSMERDHGSLFRGLGSAGPGAGSDATLTSFSGGLAQLTGALATSLGESLRTSMGVCAINGMGERGFRIILEEGLPVDADAIVLACPAEVAAAIVEDWDSALATALREIPTAKVARVHLGYREAAITSWPTGSGFIAPRGQGLRTLGVEFTSSLFPGRAPAGARLLTLTFGGTRDPEALELDDQGLIEAARADLNRSIGLVAFPYLTQVVRPATGIPQFQVGHAEILDRIAERQARQPGLHLIGCSYRSAELGACITEATQLALSVTSPRLGRPLTLAFC